MIEFIVNWNSASVNHQITISVEFEKPVRENLILASHANFVFIGKDFASYFGYTKEAIVYEVAKHVKST